MTIYLLFEPEDRTSVFRFATSDKEKAYAIAGQYEFEVIKTDLDSEDFEYTLDGLYMYSVEIKEGPCASPYESKLNRNRAWPVTYLPKPLRSVPWDGKNPASGIVHTVTLRAASKEDAIHRALAAIEASRK